MRPLPGDRGSGGGTGTVWSFLVTGLALLLAGIFTRIPGASGSLPMAEILTGAFLLAGAIAALLIVR